MALIASSLLHNFVREPCYYLFVRYLCTRHTSTTSSIRTLRTRTAQKLSLAYRQPVHHEASLSESRSSVMTPSSLGSAHAPRERYICPICNMGNGREKRAYVRKAVNNESTGTNSSSTSLLSPGTSKVYAGDFQRSTAFDKHIIDYHERIFESTNSTEYICTLCPCDPIAYGTLHCSARFAANVPGEKQRFLDHLRNFHAQEDPRSLNWYHHICSPTAITSYTDPVVRRMAESFP